MGVSNDPYKDVAETPDPWWWRADCAMPANSWIFIKTEMTNFSHYHILAKAICHDCPVLAACRKDVLHAEAGMILGQTVGIRAELSGPGRAKITASLCRECKVAKKLPHIAFCGSCREARRLRRHKEALCVA